jgi:hypothetical protein
MTPRHPAHLNSVALAVLTPHRWSGGQVAVELDGGMEAAAVEVTSVREVAGVGATVEASSGPPKSPLRILEHHDSHNISS